MKKRSKIYIILSFIILFSLLMFSSVIYAINYKILKEEHEVTAYEQNFTILTVNTINVNSFYTDNITQNQQFILEIKNNLTKEKGFDLLMLDGSPSSVLIDQDYYQTLEDTMHYGLYSSSITDTSYNNNQVMIVNYVIPAGAEISIQINATTSCSPSFVVVPTSTYNRYINSEFKFNNLNNEYRHFIDNNDVAINDYSIIYTVANNVNSTNYQQYYLLTNKNNYIVSTNTRYPVEKTDGTFSTKSNDEYDDQYKYYEKTYIYHDIYQKNCFKQVFILNDILLNNGEPNTLVNYPCNLHLLNNDIILNNDLMINHYYYGYFYIDSFTGKFNTDNYKLDIYTPYGNTLMDNNLVTDNTNFVFKSSIDLTNNNEVDVAIDDAYENIDNLISLNTQNFCTVIDDILLPNKFYYDDFTYSYKFYEATLENDTYIKSTDETNIMDGNGRINQTNDNQVIYLETTVSFQGRTKTYDKLLLIVGTSDIARLDAYSMELSYFFEMGFNTRSIEAAYIGNYNDKASLFYKYFDQDTTISYTCSGGLSLVDYIENDTNYGYHLIITSLDDSSETLTITLGDESRTILINTRGLSTFLKTEYISRYISSFVLESTSYTKVLPSITNSTLAVTGATDIRYSLWKYSGNIYSEITTYNEDTGDGYYSITYDNVNNQYDLSFIKAIPVLENEKLVLKTEICYSTESFGDISWIDPEFANDRTFYREIISMVGGLGGQGDPQYVGNQFEQYFNDNPEMIYNDGSYSFTTPEIFFRMEIDYNAMGISSLAQQEYLATYFQLIEHNPEAYASIDHIYNCTLNIITENIPRTDTTVYIKAIITDAPYKFDNGEAYEQLYSFIIPGIYHNTEDDIPDSIIYQYLLNTYNDTYIIEDDIRKEYLLRKEASKVINSLDLSYDNINEFCINNNIEGFDNNYIYNLKGLNALSNTKGFIFDDVKISNFYGLIDSNLTDNNIPNNYNITSLSLNNCSLNNIVTNLNNYEYFEAFKSLETLSLTNNQLTTLPNIYRNVTNIDLSNNLINDLSIVDTYISVETLYLSNNRIKSFEKLRTLVNKALKTVYVDSNNATSSSDEYYDLTINSETKQYYGSNGLINFANYQELIDHDITIYYQVNNNIYTPYTISTELDNISLYMNDYVKKQALVLLNSIMYQQLKNTIELPVYVIINNENININIEYVSNTHTSSINGMVRTITPSSTNGIISIILSVEITDSFDNISYTYKGYREIYVDLGGITL